MSADDNASAALSAAMRRAGFRSANAALQSGMALALEDLLRVTGQLETVFVFGSFCDGWGSCLRRIDGRIDSDSDIDITLVLGCDTFHVAVGEASVCGCSERSSPARYQDGHVTWSAPWNFGTPCIAYSGSSMLVPNIDVIAALPCCSYPSIELLQPGYRTHMSADILAALIQEVRSPRCHAVMASPPGSQCSQLRLSSTLLERIIMHRLTTVQGQLFVLLKFIVKKVINAKVKGLKTYVVKTLLFYMLDQTPEQVWRPENLLTLVRESLQLLAAMMESMDPAINQISQLDNEDHRQEAICMRHFFLRDAAVYLQSNHDPRKLIVSAINDINQHLTDHVQAFVEELPNAEVNVVHFQVFIMALARIYLVENQFRSQIPGAFEAVILILKSMDQEMPGDPKSEDFMKMLQTIDEIPDCHSFIKECIRMLAHHSFGKPIFDSPNSDSAVATFGGALCPTEDKDLTIHEAKWAVLNILQQNAALGIGVSNGRICSVAMLKNRISSLVKIVLVLLESRVTINDELIEFILSLDALHRYGWLDCMFHRHEYD